MIDLSGETLGRYTIESSIGSDATGQVYRAWQIDLGRPAALKVVEQQATTTSDFSDRFQEAMRHSAALHHTNILEIYDFGMQDGNAYLTRELADAGTLGGLLQRYAGSNMPFPIALAVNLVCQAADGLDYAHTQG